MERSEVDEINQVIKAYKTRKSALQKRKKEIINACREGKIYPWDMEAQINQIDQDFLESNETQAYQKMSKRAAEPLSTEFEEQFRKIYSLEFFGTEQPIEIPLFKIELPDIHKEYFTEEEYAEMATYIAKRKLLIKLANT